MKMMNTRFLVSLFCVLLTSCTIVKTSHVMLGAKRAPIAPEQVRLYTTAPSKYTEVAILNVDAGHDFRSAQDLMDTAIEKLKTDAAAMGANGVLLNNLGDKTTGAAVGVISRPTTLGTPAMAAMRSQSYKTVSGTAIFVEQ